MTRDEADYIVSGAEVRNFYQNRWPDGFYHEDSEVEIEDDYGEWVLPDDALVDLRNLGYLASIDTCKFEMTFADAFFEARDDAVTVVSFFVPKELLDDVVSLVEKAGGRRI